MFTLPTNFIEIESENDLEKLIKESHKLIVNFSADWCPPCRVMEGTMANLSFELEGKVLIVKIDPEKFPEISKKYLMKTIPFYLGYIDGKLYKKANGVVPIKMLKELVDEK
ncbi:thioredoxin family protein [Flammeovirga kamogawensis]|uniref:Thioredoxin family protein n=1 Tax=Flammeovirga kamogawensis TaxID=373891 RepID=A0ABX8GUL9_9BACT|nr:thioredoxin family protein [Flammeovirga kamogawensis]MBB6460025.1 thioredoxin 1 [Flammeovirga kamogawensis]QWG06927.1 thioredoxin family protein [Flammeovirga kamogawensis]TRX68748.1 thioredoxin family protein [Flammeovirga kamogawensis]